MTLLRFTDEQLRCLMQGAKRVPVTERNSFLREVADELADKSAGAGAGNLQRAIARAQQAVRDGELWGA
jgi:hypothetical protein